MITPELAPIFRGKEDELAQRFSIITRVLDGQGLQTDSGAHGRRGHRGDYLFAWLGCTTPLEDRVWKVMAQLGSRLFFLVTDSQQEVTVEDLVGSDEELPYKKRLAQCKRVVHQFLTALFAAQGVRGIPWTVAQDPRNIREWIAQLAKLLAAMRSEPVREVESGWGNYEYTPSKPEQPRRAYAVLRNIGQGHALVHGRPQLSHEDLPLLSTGDRFIHAQQVCAGVPGSRPAEGDDREPSAAGPRRPTPRHRTEGHGGSRQERGFGVCRGWAW